MRLREGSTMFRLYTAGAKCTLFCYRNWIWATSWSANGFKFWTKIRHQSGTYRIVDMMFPEFSGFTVYDW